MAVDSHPPARSSSSDSRSDRLVVAVAPPPTPVRRHRTPAAVRRRHRLVRRCRDRVRRRRRHAAAGQPLDRRGPAGTATCARSSRRSPVATTRSSREQRTRSGDTIGALLTRLGVSDSGAEAFLRTSTDARAMRLLKPGRLRAGPRRRGRRAAVAALRVQRRRRPRRGVGRERPCARRRAPAATPSPRTTSSSRTSGASSCASGEIRSSLFAATDEAGLPDGIATQIAEIFAGDIDFYRDLHRGDRFRVVYESYYQGGEFVRAGRILAVEFVNGGTVALGDVVRRPGDAQRGDARGSLLRPRRPEPAPRVPAHAARVHAHHLRLRRAPASDPRTPGASTPASTTRAPHGTPVRTIGDGVVEFAGVSRTATATSSSSSTRASTRPSTGTCRRSPPACTAASTSSRATLDRLRRHDRLGDRPAPALRVPHRRQGDRSADRGDARDAADRPREQPAFRSVAATFDRQIELLRATEGVPTTRPRRPPRRLSAAPSRARAAAPERGHRRTPRRRRRPRATASTSA